MIPPCLFDGFEVGGPSHPSRGEESCVEMVTLRGAESGAVGFSKH